MTFLDRHLRFPGTINFRDMGGYPTENGGRVCLGRMFLSGHLAFADASAQTDIAALNIGVVCDFRTDDERREHPNQYAEGHAPDMKALPVWPVGTPGIDDTVGRFMRGEINIDHALTDQQNGYREFVRDQSGQFAKMLHAILGSRHDAILLHCSAGKDRTGIASALLLTTLGVSQGDARADYMLSAEGYGAVAQTQFYVDQYWNAHVSSYGTDPVCTLQDVHQLFAVQPEKIEAAFDEMRIVGGSIDGYVRDILELSDIDRATLRQRYLEIV
ncbi:MAG: tyrosine-protein phosphatase [Rhodospirillaceae bacterium]|nr:tyrosine-protein phosphatase [Rhodospirillaceae bacterium]